jgi:hypothetical protein
MIFEDRAQFVGEQPQVALHGEPDQAMGECVLQKRQRVSIKVCPCHKGFTAVKGNLQWIMMGALPLTNGLHNID